MKNEITAGVFCSFNSLAKAKQQRALAHEMKRRLIAEGKNARVVRVSGVTTFPRVGIVDFMNFEVRVTK